MIVLSMDSTNRVLSAVEVSLGGIAGADVDSRLVLGAALTTGATRIVVAHNHPTGDVRRSLDDDRLTRRLSAAAKTVGLELADHVIVGGRGHYSYADEGRLPG